MKAPSSATDHLTLQIEESLRLSQDDKRNYAQKLEDATGISIYKYVFLLNDGSLREYIAQSRLQAQESFKLSKLAAVAGLVLVFLAIILSVVFTLMGNENLNPAYLAGVVGIVTEFIAGVFFVLYSKTLSQINLFHDKLVEMQKAALSYIQENQDKRGVELEMAPPMTEDMKLAH